MRRYLSRVFWARLLAFVLVAAFGFVGGAQAQEPVLLTIANTPRGGDVEFTRSDLEALDWVNVSTHTSFSTGLQTFEGPLLRDVLAAQGVTDGLLHARAVDGYSVEMPVHLASDYDVILALRHNGQDMSVRTKGPVRLVFPLTQTQANERHMAAEMIWQLTRLELQE